MDIVIFIKIGDKCYFKYRNCNYELNGANLNIVKNTLEYPCKLEFYKYNKNSIRLIVDILSNSNTITNVFKLEDEDSYGVNIYKSLFQKRVLNQK